MMQLTALFANRVRRGFEVTLTERHMNGLGIELYFERRMLIWTVEVRTPTTGGNRHAPWFETYCNLQTSLVVCATDLTTVKSCGRVAQDWSFIVMQELNCSFDLDACRCEQ